MIARRIVTALTAVLFFLLLELNQNRLLGWILAACLLIAFILLFESGLLRRHHRHRKSRRRTFFRVLAWVGLFALFAAIFFVTAPPVRRVPALAVKDAPATGVVSLRDGKVTGVVDEANGVEIYAGIPYAAPPVGELRWKEPQDPKPWKDVLKADTFAPMAMQPQNSTIYNSLAQIIGYHDYKWFDFSDNYRSAMSEDALYVNVWKPAGAVKDLPVLVYIHGGSLQTGRSWYADYSGTGLAKEGVIVVNMGYRLGVFGYLALPELADESPNHTTGNYGLLDQIKALEWVRDNIAFFGGDPDNVTLAGESAGSASVSALCTSPLAEGLFRRVVMESSTVASKTPPHSYRSSEDAIASGQGIWSQSRAVTLSELRALSAKSIVSCAATEHHITVDGYALTEDPYVSYSKGNFNEEAAFHGFNSRESGPFILFSGASLKNYEAKIRGYFGKYADEVLALYPASTNEEAAENWAEIYGAIFFDYPHYAYNRLAVENGISVYEYYFSKQNGRLGSWHSGEEVYLYGNIPSDSKLYDESDYELSKAFKSYFLNFIRTGDPNGEGLARFEENLDSASYLEFGEDGVAPKKESARKLGLFSVLDRIQ